MKQCTLSCTDFGLQRYAQMEQAFQQNLDELQSARDEARQQSSQQRQEVQTLRLQLSTLESDVARLTASEAMWKERSERAIEQVGNDCCKCITALGTQWQTASHIDCTCSSSVLTWAPETTSHTQIAFGGPIAI